MASLSLKALGVENEPPVRTIFYFSLTCSVVGLAAGLFGGINFSEALADPFIYLMALATLLQQITVTLGWGKGNTLLNCVFQFFGIPCAVLFGYLIYGETINLTELTGISILILSEIAALVVIKKSNKG